MSKIDMTANKILLKAMLENEEFIYNFPRQCRRSLLMKHYEEFRTLDEPDVLQRVLKYKDSNNVDERVEIQKKEFNIPIPENLEDF